jgi:hypothetical protein
MKFVPSLAPFHKRFEFVGSLRRGEAEADNVHMVVDYPLLSGGQAKGFVVGDSTIFHALMLVQRERGPFIRLRSKDAAGIPFRIESDQTLVDRMQGGSQPPEYRDHVHQVVATFACHSLRIIEESFERRPSNRHVIFYLGGPRGVWQLHGLREESFRGTVRRPIFNKALHLNAGLPIQADVFPWHYYEDLNADGHTTSIADVLVIHITPTQAGTELEDSAFLAKARALADDLCLVASFLSRRWITWFRYEFETSLRRETLVGPVRELRSDGPDFDEYPVHYDRLREFITRSIDVLPQLRGQGIDLFTPILYCASGHEARSLEEQFVGCFLALEKLRYLAAAAGLIRQINLPTALNDRIRRRISAVVENEVSEEAAREAVCEKLPELQRPAFRRSLIELLARYQTDWVDLYPPETPLSFVKTRDLLLHTMQPVDLGFLWKEYLRVSCVFERLVLRLLGWEDLSNVPPPAIRDWLVTPGGEPES